MAAGLTAARDRRVARRIMPEDGGWQRVAVLRPGHEVEVVNLAARGALLRSSARLKPGLRSELQLTGARRLAMRGRIERARVIRLEPLRYEAAMLFDEPLALAG